MKKLFLFALLSVCAFGQSWKWQWSYSAYPSSFTPKSISGLTVYLDWKQGITLNGDSVSAWADQSGLGHNATQGNSTKQPYYNKTDGVQFNANSNNDYLASALFTLPQPLTVIMVIKQNGWVNTASLFDGLSAPNTMRLYQTTASPQILMYGGNGLSNSSDCTLGSFHIISCVFNSTNSSMRVDKNATITGNAGTGTPGGYQLATHGFTPDAQITIREFLIYNRALTSAELQNIYAYLNAKEGL